MSIPKSMKERLEKEALCGAKKICTEQCKSTCANCGKKHDPWPYLKPINPEFKCPLARYEFERKVDTRPWWEAPVDEREPTNNELFALCATCEHGKLKRDEDGGYYVDTDGHFETACIDCVVNDIQDRRAEAEAEARMS